MARFLCCILLLTVGPLGRASAGLRCVPPAVNLGEVRGGPTRQHRFELINDGPTTIEIIDIERGCGCLEPRLDSKTLKPGAKTSLLVELRTAGQPNGPRSWNLRLRYRDGHAVREELLVIAATIRSDVTVQPTILALQVQDTLRQQVIVTDIRKSPLKVTAIHVSSPAIRASVVSAAGGVTKLQLEIAAPQLQVGRQDATLSIYTDDPLYNPLQLPIVLTRASKAAVTATPAQVEARLSADHPITAALVRFHYGGGHKLIIDSATADDPGIACTWASGPGPIATVKVRVDSRRLTNRDGPYSVRVQLAEPAGEVVTIPVLVQR